MTGRLEVEARAEPGIGKDRAGQEACLMEGWAPGRCGPALPSSAGSEIDRNRSGEVPTQEAGKPVRIGPQGVPQRGIKMLVGRDA